MQSKRYGPDVLAAGKPRRRELRRVPAERGLVVEDAAGQFCGAVVGCEKDAVTLEDRYGRRRVFPLSPSAFLLEGEAVKPAELGIGAWPAIPPGTPWKEGVLRALGWPPDTAAAWRRILGSVTSYADLEPAFLGRVEELMDFVTAPDSR